MYGRECLGCLEHSDGDGRVECLWVRVGGKVNEAGVMVGVCCRPLNQDEKLDEISS